MQFGISTHLYHSHPLTEARLAEIAGHGFDRVELFAARGHFDYQDAAAVNDLGAWLRSTGLTLHSVHAPIVDGLFGGRWGAALDTAAADQSARQQALDEAKAALEVARIVPYRYLVLHLGIARFQNPGRGANDRDQARRTVEQLHETAGPLGVQIALEVIPNDISTPDALVHVIEDELELRDVGVCLDFGHAFLMGDVVDAIETISGHLATTHVHDNRGKADDHLVPFDGDIDWATALMSVQKVGYEGTLLFELQSGEPAGDVLARAATARRRFEQILNEWESTP